MTLPGGATVARSSILTAAGVLVAGLVLVVHVVRTGQACDRANSDCATRSAEPTDYRGRLFTWDGRPLATRFQFVVAGGHEEGEPPVFATDRAGRFCVSAPSSPASATVIPLEIKTTAPVDPRFRGPDGYHELESAHSRDGVLSTQPDPVFMIGAPDQYLQLLGGTANPATAVASTAADLAAAAPCQQAVQPAAWHDYQELYRSWQFLLLLTLPLAAIGALAVAATPRLPRNVARVSRAAGLLGAAISLLLYFWLWNDGEDTARGPADRPSWMQVPYAQLREPLPQPTRGAVEQALRSEILRDEQFEPRHLADLTCRTAKRCSLTFMKPGIPESRFTWVLELERTLLPVCWRIAIVGGRPAADPRTLRTGFSTPALVRPLCP
jgi:hypothetical protein